MPLELDALIAEIRQAFEATPRPSADDITEAGCCRECGDLAAALRMLSWKDLLEHLAAQAWDPDPSYLLKPAAFRYFAPAYLLAAILPSPSQDPETRLFAPSFAFAPGPENADSFTTKYRDAFAPAERRAIVDYLRFLVARQTEEAEVARDRIAAALSTVWGEAR